jgi:hypothetical protein
MMHNKGLTKGCKKVTKIVTTAFWKKAPRVRAVDCKNICHLELERISKAKFLFKNISGLLKLVVSLNWNEKND